MRINSFLPSAQVALASLISLQTSKGIRGLSQVGRRVSLGKGTPPAAVMLICVICLACTTMLPCLAQQPASADLLNEIVVSATKRDTTVQTTPLAITALTGADLQAQGITDVASLVGEVPGISLRELGPGQTEFEMRGLTSVGGSSPTVGFYLDDTPITAPADSVNGKMVVDPNLYDLNRIEVLRGPQGTLYGASSMGGTIRLITNQPDTNAFDASAQTILSGTDGGGFNHAENGMVNLPLLPGILALRIVGSENQTSGWIDQIVLANFPSSINTGATTPATRGNVRAAPVIVDHHGVNSADGDGARATILFTPMEQLSIKGSMLFQQVRQFGENTYDSVPGTLAHYTPFDVQEPYTDHILLGALTVTYKLPSFDVTSSTAQWSRTQFRSEDEGENLQWAFGLPSVYGGAAGGIGPGPFNEQTTSKETSEELRLTSSGNSRFQWIVGGFYGNFISTELDTAPTPEAVPLFPTTDQFALTQPFKIDQKAAFGEASFNFTHSLKASVGLRYYSYNSSVGNTVSGYASSTGTSATASSYAAASASGTNPKFNVSYEMDDLLVYATAAKGFRPGGANGLVPNTPDTALGRACIAALALLGRTSAPTTYKPDSIWSYEVGEKATFFDRRITLNTATYYEKWSGVAQNVSIACGYTYTDNAGDAAVYGEEVEVRAILAPGLTWSGSMAYTHAALTENVLETGGHKGDQLQYVAPWTASSGLMYSRPIRGDWQSISRLDYTYVGRRIDANFFPMNNLSPYSLINARSGVSNDNWNISLFVNNLTNKRANLADESILSLDLPMYNRIATNQPLTAGVSFDFKFK
jgi:iron complex outermembrane receptor protein